MLKSGKYDFEYKAACINEKHTSCYLMDDELRIYAFLENMGMAPVQVCSYLDDVRKSEHYSCKKKEPAAL